MQSSRVSIVVSLASLAFLAANATAGEVPSLNPPDVFTGDDFGVVLAMEMADDSAMEALETVTDFSPWSDGFEFPATLPTNSAGDLPDDLPGVVYENVSLSGDSASDLSGGSGDGSAAGAFTVAAVPEPEPALLLAMGLVTFGVLRRRRCA